MAIVPPANSPNGSPTLAANEEETAAHLKATPSLFSCFNSFAFFNNFDYFFKQFYIQKDIKAFVISHTL